MIFWKFKFHFLKKIHFPLVISTGHTVKLLGIFWLFLLLPTYGMGLAFEPPINVDENIVFTVLFGHNLDPLNHWNHINNFLEHSWFCAIKSMNDCSPKHRAKLIWAGIALNIDRFEQKWVWSVELEGRGARVTHSWGSSGSNKVLHPFIHIAAEIPFPQKENQCVAAICWESTGQQIFCRQRNWMLVYLWNIHNGKLNFRVSVQMLKFPYFDLNRWFE